MQCVLFIKRSQNIDERLIRNSTLHKCGEHSFGMAGVVEMLFYFVDVVLVSVECNNYHLLTARFLRFCGGNSTSLSKSASAHLIGVALLPDEFTYYSTFTHDYPVEDSGCHITARSYLLS